MLFVLLIALLALCLIGGGWGKRRFGSWGWLPAGVLVAALVLAWFTGSFR